VGDLAAAGRWNLPTGCRRFRGRPVLTESAPRLFCRAQCRAGIGTLLWPAGPRPTRSRPTRHGSWLHLAFHVVPSVCA